MVEITTAPHGRRIGCLGRAWRPREAATDLCGPPECVTRPAGTDVVSGFGHMPSVDARVRGGQSLAGRGQCPGERVLHV